MTLPVGKTCNDCVHAARCVRMKLTQHTSIACYFDPPRWDPKPIPVCSKCGANQVERWSFYWCRGCIDENKRERRQGKK